MNKKQRQKKEFMSEDIREENAKMNKLKIKTVTKIYTLNDGTKVTKKIEVYEKSSISKEERQARLALRKEWQKQAIIETSIDNIDVYNRNLGKKSLDCEKCRTHKTCGNGLSNKLDRYTIDHQTGRKLFF